MFKLQWTVVLLIGLFSAASTIQTRLTCSPTPQPDGSVVFELSQSPQSPQCRTYWEEEDGRVIARDSGYVPERVQNLTGKSITLKPCGEYLRYRRSCLGLREEAVCTFNCSVGVPQGINSGPVNSSRCLFKDVCPHPLALYLPLGLIIVVLAAIPLGVCMWKKYSRRRRDDAVRRAVEDGDARRVAVGGDEVRYSVVREEDKEEEGKIDVS